MFNTAEIGKRIAEIRKLKHMTQMELAENMAVSFQAVSSWERGETMPDISRLGKLAQALNISIDELLTDPNHSEKFESLETTIPPINIKEQCEKKEGISIQIASFEDIVYRASYLDQSTINTLVEDHIHLIQAIEEIVYIAPFITRELIKKCIMTHKEKIKSFEDVVYLCEYLDKDTANTLVLDNKHRIKEEKEIYMVAPYIDQYLINELLA
ncbi:MAG: helix-turn-helix domain-containing protein [Cellulosilyticaceae bacterium]